MLKFNQTYTESSEIRSLLIAIESHRETLKLIPQNTPERLANLRRTSLLNSAVYSAKIEGIRDDTDLNKLAIQNLLNCYTHLYQQELPIKIDRPFLKSLHKQIMHGLRSDAGSLRTEQSAIFNSAGVAIYLTPPPQELSELLAAWQKQVNNTCLPIPIRAAISHYQFEKIHPFLDGNGRVGRLVTTTILRNYGYDLGGMLSFEGYLNTHRPTYYDTLSLDKKDITSFVTFFLTALSESGTLALTALASPTSSTSSLLPRRGELLSIIRDHGTVSFDFLHRRFMSIPMSTLRYDLLQLQKGGYITKLGTTRGAMYRAK